MKILDFKSPMIQEGCQPKASLLGNEDHKVKTVSKSVFKDLLVGLKSSRILRATALSVISTATLLLVISNPASWAIATVFLGAFFTSLVAQAILDKGVHKISFELTALKRLFKKGDNFNEIINIEGNKLYLGALPNRLDKTLEKLNKDKKLSILSVNEDWERKPLGLSLPYSEKDLKELGVNFKPINTHDHTYLSFEQLDEAANFIEKQLEKGDVYVHCRAGKGRSAMAVAAYLIKKGMRAENTAKLIKTQRPVSTIYNKLENKKDKYGNTVKFGLYKYDENYRSELRKLY